MEVKVIDGFQCYAPIEFSDHNHFPEGSHKELYELEAGHFWFTSRNRIILKLVDKFLPNEKKQTTLEIGCGTGYVLEAIAKANPNFEMEGTELYLEGLKFAQKRSPQVTFYQSDARALPYKNKYDAVMAFDVIEHIEEDETTLKSIFNSLKTGGHLFLTVPQHMWLWSQIDDYACHKRRYAKKELIQKLESAGFSVRYTTSFVFTLLPLMWLSRLKKSDPNELNEFKISKFANLLLSVGMKIDEALINIGFSLPAGGSLLAVAQKNK